MNKKFIFWAAAGLLIQLLRSESAKELPQDAIERICKKENMDLALVTKYARYFHMPIFSPVREGLSLDVPEKLGNKVLAAQGLVDITAAPFNADPTGKKDSTVALQKAMDFAQEQQMAAFFPIGSYLISASLEPRMKLTFRMNGRIQTAKEFAPVLIGTSYNGKRPVIVLADNAAGFNNPENPKIVVNFRNMSTPNRPGGSNDPLADFSGSYFNPVFRNIDIRIGKSNAGAIGIRMQAPEGAGINNVTIDATHGYKGMQGAAGSGGGHHNITIIGGRIGIDTRGYPPEYTLERTGTQPTPVMAGITLIGQTETPLIVKARGALIAAGWKIILKKGFKGPAIINYSNPGSPFDSSLCLADSIIKFEEFSIENILLSSERSFLMENVYIKNCGLIEKKSGYAGKAGWTKIQRIAYAVKPRDIGNCSFDESPYLNGKKLDQLPGCLEFGMAPLENFTEKHIWKNDFPDVDHPAAANVKSPEYGARGDFITDDTKALQKAVNSSEIVFLPKGYYRISKTVKFKSNTKLIGVSHHLSVIISKNISLDLPIKKKPLPLLETADTAQAETYLSYLGVYIPFEAESAESFGDTVDIYALKWMCGGNSVVRCCAFNKLNLLGFPEKTIETHSNKIYTYPLVMITDNGGGKWYNFFNQGSPGEIYINKTFRYLTVSNSSGPVSFYQLHAQHAQSQAQVEIINSANVTVYGIKTEYDGECFMRISDSDKIRIYGHGGIGTPLEGSAHYYFINVNNFLFANFAEQVNLKETMFYNNNRKHIGINDYFPLFNIQNNTTNTLPKTTRPILYIYGNL